MAHADHRDRHRRWVVLRGTPAETAEAAAALLAGVEPAAVLWVGDAPSRWIGVPRHVVRRLLGQAFDAVVIDAHAGIDADLLGQSQGFIWGGGVLVLRLPPDAPPGDPGLVVAPYTAADVGQHFFRRVEALFVSGAALGPEPARLCAVRQVEGTAEQAAVVSRLTELMRVEGGRAVLLSDRGRGKSSALGLALRASAHPGRRVAVTAEDEASAAEVFRFAGSALDGIALDGTAPDATALDDIATFVPVTELARGVGHYDVIVIDEAARIPVPVLQRIVRAHPRACLAFATTARGYEGTGRGFVLRFLAWLDGLGAPVERLTLTQPIRWAAGDPLEARVATALLLDAEPAAIPSGLDLAECKALEGNHSDKRGREIGRQPPARPQATTPAHHEVRQGSGRGRKRRLAPEIASAAPSDFLTVPKATRLTREQLAADEALLRGFFGLLVHAHYRTTPSDLHRLLDAPNLHAHAILHRGRVVAAGLVAEEGNLDAHAIDAIARGDARIRGHALPETLVCHAGHPEAGAMRIVRSVRIASHPALRRMGLGSALVDHMHATHAPDFFGTVFGATPALLRFRRDVGYALVRVGVNPGNRTGEPAAVMMRPVSARAHALCATLRAELARDLPAQLVLMQADDELALSARLVAALGEDQSEPAEMTPAALQEGVMAYAFGPRPLEASAGAITVFVEKHAAALPTLGPSAALLRARVLDRRGWITLTGLTGQTSVRAAMRATRRAMQALVRRVEPGWVSSDGIRSDQ